ncbi:MAG: TraB/GumN family protein [Tissierellia bacterium]|nr:TraB/GumN family protein [Tissierellia bacterium]
MNYSKSLLVILSFLVFLSCTAQPKKDNSLLWKVSGNGLEEPSYLFGTHHLIPVSFLDSVAGIHDAFENTEQTVGEIDMSNMAEMQMMLKGHSQLPEGVTYESLLSPEEITQLDSTLKNLLHIGLDQLGTLKPSMLSNLISITFYQKYYPTISNDANIDQYFQSEAIKRNRPIIGLENTEDQIYVLLNAQTIERQAEMLICMVQNPDLLKEQMDELQEAYHSQDINALFELSVKDTPNDPCPSTEEEKNALNKDRNIKWLEKLPAIMADKPSFIAVGSLHLPGEVGLIEGLRARGYNVEPVS